MSARAALAARRARRRRVAAVDCGACAPRATSRAAGRARWARRRLWGLQPLNSLSAAPRRRGKPGEQAAGAVGSGPGSRGTSRGPRAVEDLYVSQKPESLCVARRSGKGVGLAGRVSNPNQVMILQHDLAAAPACSATVESGCVALLVASHPPGGGQASVSRAPSNHAADDEMRLPGGGGAGLRPHTVGGPVRTVHPSDKLQPALAFLPARRPHGLCGARRAPCRPPARRQRPRLRRAGDAACCIWAARCCEPPAARHATAQARRTLNSEPSVVSRRDKGTAQGGQRRGVYTPLPARPRAPPGLRCRRPQRASAAAAAC